MEGEMPKCGEKRKSLIVLGSKPIKKFKSPLVLTSLSGIISTKTHSRLNLQPSYCVQENSDNQQEKDREQFLARISQVHSLLKSKAPSSDLVVSTQGLLVTPWKGERNVHQQQVAETFSSSSSSSSAQGLFTPRRNAQQTMTSSFSTPRSSERGAGLSGVRIGGGVGEGTKASSRKIGPPMSGRKMKMRASLQLRMMECQELQASRAARSRTELWMERQERAYCAWLNHLLRQPMQDVQRPISSSVSPPRQSCVGAEVGVSSARRYCSSQLRSGTISTNSCQI